MNQKIEAESREYYEIFKKISEKHIIPTLQRPYVWKDKKEVKKFLDDIKENGNNYFVGSLVFVSSNKGTTGREEIIDGQQRMITISLILISIRNIIEEFKMQNEFKNILEDINSFLITYQQKGDIARLKFSDENTDMFYSKLLRNEMIENPETETQKRLKTNYLYIVKELKVLLINDKRLSLENSKVEEYFEKIKSLQVIGITCKDNTVAYELFESINATGISLASVDLIKNFIFKNLRNSALLRKAEDNWQKIEDLFSEDRSLLKTFIRHQWISDGQYISHAGLYGAVETKCKEKKLDPFKYLTSLLDDGRIYLSLRNANIEVLERINSGKRFETKIIKEDLEFLSFLNVDQVYAPILFFYKNTTKNNFIKHLNKLAAFQFLYKYIPGSPSSAEKIFADFSKNGNLGFKDGFKSLVSLVEKSKDTFKEHFIDKALYKEGRSGDIQFILERYIFSRGGPLSFKKPTIEHIISQDISRDRILQKIGNLTIFEKDINSKLPIQFKEKTSFYEESSYAEHKDILDKYEFDNNYKKSIIRRSEDIADQVYDIFIEVLKTGKYR